MPTHQESIELLAQTLSSAVGEQQATTAALCGLLRALADLPGVKHHVSEALERSTAANLAQSLNVDQVAQFDATSHLLRLAAGLPPAG